MIQLNNLLIDGDYVLYAPNRKSSRMSNSIVTFKDGSTFNFQTGEISDTNADSKNALVSHFLAQGKNSLSFGSLNQKPKTLSWLSNSLEVIYPGPIEILPSNSGEIQVEENSYCFASNVGVVKITPADYTEICVNKKDKQDPQVSYMRNTPNGEEYPLLRIWAPANTMLTGECKSANFTQLGIIDLQTNIISGNQADQITIYSDDSIVFLCSKIIGNLKLKASGKIKFKNQLQAKSIEISTNDKVSADQPVAANCISVVTHDRVTFASVYATTLDINSNDKIIIENGVVNSLTIDSNDSVTVNLQSCETIVVDTNDKVSISVTSGTTSTKVKSNDKVLLKLNIANKTTVKTNDRVEITANTYLIKPEVKTSDRCIIR